MQALCAEPRGRALTGPALRQGQHRDQLGLVRVDRHGEAQRLRCWPVQVWETVCRRRNRARLGRAEPVFVGVGFASSGHQRELALERARQHPHGARAVAGLACSFDLAQRRRINRLTAREENLGPREFQGEPEASHEQRRPHRERQRPR